MFASLVATVLRPWRTTATWRAFCHLCLDALLGGLVFPFALALAAASIGLLVVFPAAVVTIWLLFVGAHGYARLERSRYAALLDLDLLDGHPELGASTPWGRWKERLTSRWRWREVAYALVHYPVSWLTSGLALGTWAASVGLMAMPLVVGRLRGGAFRLGPITVERGGVAWLLGGVGVIVLVLVAPWVTVAMANVMRWLGRGLLGRTERAEFQAKVDDLETRRTAAVESAEAVRRRIERDLHDGAQQRLISVAMNLGIARQRLEDDPDAARELVGSAHDEVKSALKELRDLIRGIHPPVLDDRGLDAALSAVVARCPVPVDLRVDVAVRPAAAVESAAYFIVSEALVNVMRHSRATAATVEIARRGDRLTIVVADNGIGGAVAADPSSAPAPADGGTGLRGLMDRVTALDGWMQIVSPAGGPTTLLVELPCGS